MFGFLKDKLKNAIAKLTKKTEVEAKVEEVPATPVPQPEAKPAAAHPAPKKESVPAAHKGKEKKEEPKAEKAPAAKPAPAKPKEHKEELVSASVAIPHPVSSKAPAAQPVVHQPTSPQPATVPAPVPHPIPSHVTPKKKDAVRTPLPPAPVTVPKREEKEGFFARLTKVTLSEEKFEEVFWDLEVTLLENNVAVEVIERIKMDLKAALTGGKVSRGGVEGLIMETLRQTITDILSLPSIDLVAEAARKRKKGEPLIIAMIGVNGSGKTTTLAKLVKYFQDHDLSVVVAAADTFRAAAIQQLEEHTNRLGVKLIKHDYGADPAAVAFDAVKHALAKGIDIVLIDSAGRLHSNDNLMNELKKLIRVNKPDLNLFVGEAITGNDCVEQAKLFDEAVGIDGIILAKADVDEKGGAAISASFVTNKPVLFLGTGQRYEDLKPFEPELVLKGLGL